MGLRVAGAADLAGMHGATPEIAAAAANVDCARGVFPDGPFPAGAWRKIDRPGIGLGGLRGGVGGTGAVHGTAFPDDRWRNRPYPAPRQRASPGPQPLGLRA